MTVSYLTPLYNKEQFIAGVMDAVLAEHAQTGGRTAQEIWELETEAFEEAGFP